MNLKNRTLSMEIEYYQEIWNFKKNSFSVEVQIIMISITTNTPLKQVLGPVSFITSVAV